MKLKPVTRNWLVVTAVILSASLASPARAITGRKTAIVGFTACTTMGSLMTGSVEAAAGVGIATMLLMAVATRPNTKPRDNSRGDDVNPARSGSGGPPSGGASARLGSKKLTWFADPMRRLLRGPQGWMDAEILTP